MTTMTPEPGFVTGGVDTHLDIHVVAAVDHLGGLLGTASFPTTASGYRETAGCGRNVEDLDGDVRARLSLRLLRRTLRPGAGSASAAR
jgi:hypothetical protein